MMNRSVMQRQMFKDGGAAGFPDLSGDGKITQKDILMGRGVVGMQMGGDPMMAMNAQQDTAMPPMAASAMPPMAAPADNPEAIMQAGAGELDPAQVEQLLTMASESMGDPEQAGSYEEMMNLVRGDQASIQERRAELANLVGEQDAMQTPESVLALLQPVVQVASMSPEQEVDRGIGALAEQEMQQPVAGNMAGGIMSMMGG
tara:strand:+ start:270 stop:875 length:606 start_codon:yes stop_codon:yes gene_type:complete